jgi:hypothetical protein
MEPEFLHILVRVLIVGFAVVIAGTTALFLAFRSFGKPGSHRGVIWLMAISFVILIVCAVLWRLSYGPE